MARTCERNGRQKSQAPSLDRRGWQTDQPGLGGQRQVSSALQGFAVKICCEEIPYSGSFEKDVSNVFESFFLLPIKPSLLFRNRSPENTDSNVGFIT